MSTYMDTELGSELSYLRERVTELETMLWKLVEDERAGVLVPEIVYIDAALFQEARALMKPKECYLKHPPFRKKVGP